MANNLFFSQECPTCGRHLHIHVEYLGKKVVCQHCHGRLVARDPASASSVADPAETLLERAEELLEYAAIRYPGEHTRITHPR